MQGFLSPVSLKDALPKEVSTSKTNQEDADKVQDGEKETTVKDNQEEQGINKDQTEEGEKKSRKSRGSALMEELLWSGKRRSARVRSSLRGNPEPMDVAEALRRILPRKLL